MKLKMYFANDKIGIASGKIDAASSE